MMKYKEWWAYLKENGLITPSEKHNAWQLQVPFMVKFSDEVIAELKDEYDENMEIGGLLFGQFKREGVKKVLTISKCIFLPNLSDSPENTYEIDEEKAEKTIRKAILNSDSVLIPITFHSHPILSLYQRVLQRGRSPIPIVELMDFFNPVVTSEEDQERAPLELIKIARKWFLMPSGLLIQTVFTPNEKVFTFYGGGIAPEITTEFIGLAGGQLLADFFKLVSKISDNEVHQMIIQLMGVLGLIGAMIAKPTMVFPLIVSLALKMPSYDSSGKHFSSHKYLGILEPGVSIDIPEKPPRPYDLRKSNE